MGARFAQDWCLVRYPTVAYLNTAPACSIPRHPAYKSALLILPCCVTNAGIRCPVGTGVAANVTEAAHLPHPNAAAGGPGGTALGPAPVPASGCAGCLPPSPQHACAKAGSAAAADAAAGRAVAAGAATGGSRGRWRRSAAPASAPRASWRAPCRQPDPEHGLATVDGVTLAAAGAAPANHPVVPGRSLSRRRAAGGSSRSRRLTKRTPTAPAAEGTSNA